MRLTDEVRQTAERIVASGRSVTVDTDALGALDPGPPPELDRERHYLEGAALWAPPDAWAAPPGELLRGIRALTPHRALITVYGLGDIERVHPRQTHFYLSVLGVEPGRQGQGVGSRLIGPGLEMCDREGVPAYLETAKARNVTFYERHGFRVTDERRLPRGPKVWLMWREPR